MLCLILSALFGTKKRWKRMESVLSCFMGITLTSADLWIRRWPMSDHNQMGSQRSLQLFICVFFFRMKCRIKLSEGAMLPLWSQLPFLWK